MLQHAYSPVKGAFSFYLLFCVLLFSISHSNAYAQMEAIDFMYNGKGSTFINKPIAIAISDEGDFLYLLSKGSDAISIFSRDASTGDLTFLEEVNNIEGNTQGLKGASDLILSDDGGQLYVAAAIDESISVYTRNPDTGLLTFSACHKNNTGEINGLEEVSSIVITPNGNVLFAAGAGENGIVVFSRNREDGSLTYESTLYNGVDDVTGLQYPTDLVLNPVSNSLYATCYSGHSLVVFEFDPYSPDLIYHKTYVDGNDGVEGLEGALTSAITPDGTYLYTIGKASATVSLFKTNSSNQELEFLGVSNSSINAAGGLNEATFITTINEGDNILISNSGNNSLLLFDRDIENGDLIFNKSFTNGVGGVSGLEYVHAVAESPDLKNVYVGAFEEKALAIFNQNVTDGTFAFSAAVTELVDVQKMKGTFSVAISPVGQHAYSASGLDHSLVVFGRSNNDGTLTYKRNYQNGIQGVSGLKGARAVKVSPDGTNVYVAGFLDNALAVFTRDQSTGILSFHSQVTETEAEGLRGPYDLIVSQDGRFVYVTAFWENALFVFSRNISTGALSFVEKIIEEKDNGLKDLGHLTALAFSSDQNQLYTTSFYNHTLSVFDRNTSSGQLSFKEKHKNGEADITGLKGACALAVSPNGERIIVAGKKEEGVVTFQRNTSSGALTFETNYMAEVDGHNIEGLVDLKFSSDGLFVYGASYTKNYLVKYAYDPDTGVFSEGEILLDDLDEVNGLGGAASIDISSDGQYIYVGSYHDDAIAVFKKY